MSDKYGRSMKQTVDKQANEKWIENVLTLDDTVALYKTVKISDINSVDAVHLIKGIIKKKTPEHLALSSILNAIFSQQTSAFMITKRGLDRLLKYDVNHNCEKLHPRSYQLLMEDMETRGVWEVRVRPTGSRGGLYILQDSHIINILKLIMVDKSYEEIENQRIKKYYELQSKESNDHSTKSKKQFDFSGVTPKDLQDFKQLLEGKDDE